MFNLPEKIKNFTPYEPLVGDYKIRLDVNESFIEIDRDLINGAINGVKLNRYPDPFASAAVTAFAEMFGVKPANVTAGNGSDELLGIIASSMLEKGGKVLCLSPDFSMYGFYSRLYELETAVLEKNADMTVNIGELTDYINNNGVKALFFSNPCNPTSLGVVKNNVMRLVEGVSALVVLDEAYMDFWDEKESLVKEAQIHKNLIVLRTCSKSVAIAGLRFGFAVACDEITAALKTVKSPFNVNSLTQAIGAAVLSDRDNYRKNICAVKMNTFWLYNALDSLKLFDKIYDTRTNFVFAETKKAREIYEYLLSQSIAVRLFNGHLRICAGSERENTALIDALKAFGN